MTLRFRGKEALEQGISRGFINETEYFYVIPSDFTNESHMLSSIIALTKHMNWPVMKMFCKSDFSAYMKM